MSLTEVLVALVILVGMVGIIIQIIPGSLLILAALLVWAVQTGGTTAWVVFGIAAALLVAGSVVKYVVPGRRLKAAGVPTRTLLLGALGAVVGFFVIPVVGILVGFVAGIYAAEHVRVGRTLAGPSTKHALRAVGVSILIELTAATAATLVWVAGVVAT
ncbi:DUF456 domain-containing protein [Nocardioides sp.]|uniref:DUF456 domain-containing protein n=1 Tax=Nocardioides sp. TaxID=35761 RepID=UPI002736E130|nr:DUF456 domain-containing protein [Nocardioides sp.]MDP3890700.1 DUF456 domain-containing protein [Nocardioides sp.]